MKLLGGLINIIDDDNLLALRDRKLYTDDENRFIDLLTIKHDSTAVPIGSFTHKIQKYPSDIDIQQVVKIKNDDFDQFIKDLQGIIKKIQKSHLVYFSDMKAGVDERYPDDKDKFVLRWAPDDILKGYKILPKNKKITLEEAIQMQSIIKLDVIVFADNRFIEESTFFILEKVMPDGETTYINVPENYYDMFVDELKKDIKKYSQVGDNFKLFKAVKRMWSLARLNKDIGMLKRLKPLIASNLSLLSQINADLETIELLIEKVNNKPYKEIIKVVDLMGKKISTIADIKIDNDFVDDKIEQIKHASRNGNDELILEEANELHDYLLKILNRETAEYMDYAGLLPISKDYSGGCHDPTSPYCPKKIKKGDGIATKIYQKLANAYRKVSCDNKSRELYDGELHPSCYNYCGPGTRIDLNDVRNFPPYDEIDNVCREHDLDYDEAKNKPNKEQLIRKADKDMLSKLEQFKGKKGYNLAKFAISGKVKAENLLPSLIKSKFSEHYGSD